MPHSCQFHQRHGGPEDDEEFKNQVDLMFDLLESEKPNHRFAVRQYKKYKW